MGFVIYVLLLFDYVKGLVVQVDDFYWQVVLFVGGQFLDVYLDIVFVGNVQYFVVWVCQFDVYGGWQIEVYGVQVIGVDLVIGFVEFVVLGSKYLVLIYVGSDEGFIIGELVQYFDDFLGFDYVVVGFIVYIMECLLFVDLFLSGCDCFGVWFDVVFFDQ